MPAVAVVNGALAYFEPKVVFDWHLSIIIDFESLADNSMPTDEERNIVDPFQETLDSHIKSNPEKPNALFLARITWNKTRQLLYRVNTPQLAHEYLQSVIEVEDHPRHFDYQMFHDEEWEQAAWYLNATRETTTD